MTADHHSYVEIPQKRDLEKKVKLGGNQNHTGKRNATQTT